MTGGRLVVRTLDHSRLNEHYLETVDMTDADDTDVRALLQMHVELAKSPLAARLLENNRYRNELAMAVPRGSRAVPSVRAAG